MLKVSNLTKEFKAGDGSTITAVNDVSFAVSDGVFASIIGKSGSGKSTLLSLLGALDRPTSGNIEVADKNIEKINGRELDDYRCHEIGFVFQNYQLIPNLTARENVCLAMEFAGVDRPTRIARAEELLDQVGIKGARQLSRPGKLSGGEQQRVAIARALANKPNLILADEPTGNLDDTTGKMIFDLLHQLSRKENATVVAVTHDLDIAGRTDMSFRISDGKLVETTRSRKK
ncbi:ABC transporter ATP-binding protein [Candidatus Saccharibacteria bacterium]|nr:ABC transporter ATP-binding protein [Candidatus Saccharibacteria bacterium]